jgi:hypothetical protein
LLEPQSTSVSRRLHFDAVEEEFEEEFGLPGDPPVRELATESEEEFLEELMMEGQN